MRTHKQYRRICANAALCLVLMLSLAAPAVYAQAPAATPLASAAADQRRFLGMDDSVNTDLAAKAGVPARKPYINTEEWGDLWNFVLLLGGGICGFVIGRRWDHIWGRRHAA